MASYREILVRTAHSCARSIARLKSDKRANVAMMFALMLPVLVGGLGMGMESAYWYVDQRSMQNASDAAALAAAGDATANYGGVAGAVAATYGYQNGVNGVTVAATNTAPCPGGGSTCYKVDITYKQQLYLLPVIGVSGDTTVGGQPAQTIRATATATVGTTSRQYCLLALNSVGTPLVANGGPQANFSGCNTMSNGSALCHGHDLQADHGDAHIIDTGCGVIQESGVPIVPDPYSALAANIPPDTCGGAYPQEPSSNHDPNLPASNQWTGAKNLAGNVQVCGDLQLTGDVTINAPAGAVLVIENGRLDTNGHTIRTASGSALTVVFSGTNDVGYIHAPTNPTGPNGTIDIQAPSSGVWSGVALYQDPNLTVGVDISEAGNSPAWDISGLVYLPHANVTFDGIVNKSSNGASCFALVVADILINGTGSIVAHGGCDAAGLTLPTGQVPGRGVLVI